MKKTGFLILFGLALLATSCTQNTYSYLRGEEDKLIANYISRHHYKILTEEPADNHVWADDEFYKVVGRDNLYFHLIERGDTTTNPISADKNYYPTIVVRYKKFDLTEYPDTMSYWNTLEMAHPYEFKYGDLSSCEATGWHIAVGLMKYHEAMCEVLIPSKLGFTDDETSVTPYVYIMKILVKQ